MGKQACWKLSSSPRDLDGAPVVYWGGAIPLRLTETVCGEGQHCLRPSKQRWLGSRGRESQLKGVERALDLAAAVWS